MPLPQGSQLEELFRRYAGMPPAEPPPLPMGPILTPEAQANIQGTENHPKMAPHGMYKIGPGNWAMLPRPQPNIPPHWFLPWLFRAMIMRGTR